MTPEQPAPGEPLPYQYVTLRAVPRVEREEFVNVGVVVFCEAADVLAVAHRLDAERLRALFPGVDLDGLRRALRGVEAVCEGHSVTGLDAGRRLDAGSRLGGDSRIGARFGWLAAPRSTVLQPGPRHGGLTRDPAGEADRLLGRLVG